MYIFFDVFLTFHSLLLLLLLPGGTSLGRWLEISLLNIRIWFGHSLLLGFSLKEVATPIADEVRNIIS